MWLYSTQIKKSMLYYNPKNGTPVWGYLKVLGVKLLNVGKHGNSHFSRSKTAQSQDSCYH